MNNQLAQPTYKNKAGYTCVEDDWYPGALPANAEFAPMSYPDSAYSFAAFFSTLPQGLSLGFASGNYALTKFTTGVAGKITVGQFVVLVTSHLVCNSSVQIKDHCMLSWQSVVTDSWVTAQTQSVASRRQMLKDLAHSPNRHLQFTDPRPVVIEQNAWIGFGAVILPGVTIGRGAIVGSKSVVKEDIPPYAIAVGNPARIIKYLEPSDTPEMKQEAMDMYDAWPAKYA